MQQQRQQRQQAANARSGHALAFLVGLATFLVLLPLYLFNSGHSSTRTGFTTLGRRRKLLDGQYDTLVVYNFGYWDPEHLANFNYFIKYGIRADDGARYTIILDYLIAPELIDLPPFPPNVQVVKAVGQCSELGLAAWLLKRYPGLLKHKYFVFVDSSVRGPFVPVYVEKPWHKIFTERITDVTKIVGSTISCAPFKYNNAEGGYIIFPYVSGYAWATDAVGMSVLNDTAPPVLHCYHDKMDIQRFGVIGPSEAMLRHNYNLGSLMMKYAGVDFRDGSKWACNDRVDPHLPNHYDGTHINPLEVMFIRIDHASLVTEIPNAHQAAKYEEWLTAKKGKGKEDISANEYKQKAIASLQKIKARGVNCFNAKYYIQKYPVEMKGWTGAQAWEHFLQFGFLEGRTFEFIC